MGPSCGGDEGNRTPDPLLAKQVLSQLSYTPMLRVSFFQCTFPGTFKIVLFEDTVVPSKLNNENRFAILDCSFAAIRDRSAIHEHFGTMADHRMLRLFVSSVEVSLERR